MRGNMKKIKKFVRFLAIAVVVFVVLGYISQFLFKILWNFEIFNHKSYELIYEYWEKGGVFNTFKDCSLAASLFLLPIIGLILSYKLYKFGLVKFITLPISKLYRRLTRPKVMEVEHVTIKNLGGKDKTLDEIIDEKIKEENKSANGNMVSDLRKQIAAKIEENEKE